MNLLKLITYLLKIQACFNKILSTWWRRANKLIFFDKELIGKYSYESIHLFIIKQNVGAISQSNFAQSKRKINEWKTEKSPHKLEPNNLMYNLIHRNEAIYASTWN